MNTLKEQIIIAVLTDMANQNNEDALNDLNCIKFHEEGYEKLLDIYTKQIITILEKGL